MTVSTFETGQDVSVTATFRNEQGQLVDPSSVSIIVYMPDGTVLTPTPTISAPALGIRTSVFNLSMRGTWAVRWESQTPTTRSDDLIIADWSSTPAATPLVTLQEYRDITQDFTSDNERVTAMLARAVSLVSEYLQRELARDTYTETLEVWYEDGIGYVYPLITPVESVPASAAYEVDFGERRLRGVIANAQSGVTWPVLTPDISTTSAVSPYTRSRPDYATVTYTGGFTNATLPQTLKEYIAFIARALIRRTTGTLIGAQEVAVGDVRVKYPAVSSALDALVPGVTLGLKGYRRKRVRF